MDDLLARALAHREVLKILIRLALPTDEERLLACNDAAEAFQSVYIAEPMAIRVRQSIGRALAELEEIFDVPEPQPKSGLGGALPT